MRKFAFLLGMLVPAVAVAQPVAPPAISQLKANPSGGRTALGMGTSGLARQIFSVNPQTLAGRAPAGTDDSTAPYPVGASWALGSTLFQAADTTAGFATWQQAQTSALPLDILGVNITNVSAAVSGGTGYAVGDVNYYPGGATLKVLSAVSGVITQPSFTASISGAVMTVTNVTSGVISASAGIFGAGITSGTTIISDGTGTGGVGTYNLNISQTVSSESIISSEVLIVNPLANTCPSSLSGTVGQVATTGSGSGATFTFTLLKPTAYGTRQLTKCYTGNAMTVARSDTGETKAISFLAGGDLDVATLDGFTSGQSSALAYTNYNSGVSARVSIWNDQGGGGNDATQTTATNRPTISPGRLLGNARSVMFDSVGQANSWHPTLTSLTLPSGVSVNPANSSLAVLAGTVTENFNKPAYLQLGCLTGSCFVTGIDVSVFSPGLEYNNGVTTAISTTMPSDGPMLFTGVSTSSSTVFDAGNTSLTIGTGGVVGTVSGGALGAAANNAGNTGHVDEAAVIIVPWAIPTATRLALKASTYHTFAVPPQQSAVIVTVGDSHVDDWAEPYQQTWPRQMMTLLNRQDVTLVNAGQAGAQLSNLVSAGNWNAYVAPSLTASNSPYKFVILEGCYNDLAAGQTVSQCEASYTTGITETHAAGAKAVCETNVIRSGTLTLNQNVQAISAWLRTNPGCDYVLDMEAYSVFNAASGPWNAPWFQSDQTHLTPAGAGLEAALAAKVMAPLLP